MQAAPGKALNLTAVAAPDARAAAEYYPAELSGSRCLKVPDKSEFPGTGPQGNGISAEHQKPGAMAGSGEDGQLLVMPSAGQQGHARDSEEPGHLRFAGAGLGAPDPIRAGGRQHDGRYRPGWARSARWPMFADWTDRIAAGELPPAPPRPQGVERNVVITEWDWADPKAYLHDEIATDKRNPTVNANGLLYGAPELSTDNRPGARSGAPHGEPGEDAGARSEDARRPGSR